MALVRPVLKNIPVFQASDEYVFGFYYTGSNQAVKNNLIIQRISDNTIVYNGTIETLSLSHTLPPSTLTNGISYKVKVRVADINGTWSDYSEEEIFWALSNPIVNITNIDYENQNRVYNQTVIFTADYSQSEGELLQSYRYLLYDENQNIITNFDEVYSDGSNPLTQEIAGLENGKRYFLEVKTISINGGLGSSGLIWFKPFYVAPRLDATLTVENIPNHGAIKVTSNILQIIGKVYDVNNNEITNVIYTDGEWLDLTGTQKRLEFDEGFNVLQSDFIMSIWAKDIIDNKVFLSLYSEYGRIDLVKDNNKILAYKFLKDNNNVYACFASNELTINSGEEVLIYLKSQYDLLDVKLDKVI